MDQVGGAESQIRALLEYCSRYNITEYEIFNDHGISGTKEEQTRLDELTKSVIENKSSTESSVETMKAMNVPADVIQQVQNKIESTARDKVHEVMGGQAYETYD